MKVVSLFSGAGGMDLGFLRAGFEIVWANDTYGDAVNTYRNNIGDHIVEADIRTISPAVKADVVIGGFPCQGFSVANWGRSVEDERNTLYLEMLRVIRETRPAFFVAENVKGLLSMARGKVFDMILADFRSFGYEVTWALLNAADYGVPQRRERLFIVGRDPSRTRSVEFPPKRTHAPREKLAAGDGLSKWVSVGDALGNLPEPGLSSGLPNHSKYSAYKLRFNGHLGHRRIDPEVPAPTVTARGDERGGVVVLHHPGNHRRISPREAATIQGFPLTYAFFGTQTSAYRQIANAVPPPLAEAVARCLMPASLPTQEQLSIEQTTST